MLWPNGVVLAVFSLPPVPAPVCSDPPQVEDDRLVVRWTYTHRGGVAISSTEVFYNIDTTPERQTAFSSVSGAVSEEDTEASIPLPEAGLHYQFRVRTENSQGATEMTCPGIRLDIGQYLYIHTSYIYMSILCY